MESKTIIGVIKWWFLIFGLLFTVVSGWLNGLQYGQNILLQAFVAAIELLSIWFAFTVDRSKKYKLMKSFFCFRAIYSLLVCAYIYYVIVIAPGKIRHFLFMILPLTSAAFSVYLVVWLNKRQKLEALKQ